MPKYTVHGVDRESGMDTELVVHADSEANAGAKAGLKGVLATRIVINDVAQTAPTTATPVTPPAGVDVQTIEQTSKKWKFITLMGIISLLSGCFLSMVGPAVGSGVAMLGMAMIVGGIGAYIYGRVMSWWHHG